MQSELKSKLGITTINSKRTPLWHDAEYILLNKFLALISLSPQVSYGYEIIYFKQLTRMVDP